MRLRSLAVTMLTALVLLPMAASSASAAVRPPVAAKGLVSTTTPYEVRVLALTNAERTRRGLKALAFSTCADVAADAWAGTLSGAGALSHQPLMPVLTRCGARAAGENVAFGNVSAEAMVAMWMKSPGHRANVLRPGYTHLGVGSVTTTSGRVYGVQVFLTL